MTLFEKKLIWGVPIPWRHDAAFSPDMRYFLLAYRDNRIVIDLQKRSEMSVSDSLSDGVSAGFTFLSADRLAAESARTLQVTLLAFPSGKILSKLPISPFDGPFRAPGHGDYVVFGDRRGNHASVVMDTATHKVVVLSTQQALDIYDSIFVMQAPDGTLGLYDANPVARRSQLTLPGGTLSPRALVVSPDLGWLAVSKQEHGAIWELRGGKQVSDSHEFRGGWFSGDGWFYADFPKIEGQAHEVVRVPLAGKQSEGAALKNPYVQQIGHFLVVTTPKTPVDPTLQYDDGIGPLTRLFWRRRLLRSSKLRSIHCDVTIEVSEIDSGKVLWSRQFANNVPGFVWRPDEGKVFLKWPAATPGARDEVHKYPQLENELKASTDKKDKQLPEVLDILTGDVLKASLPDADLAPWDIIGEPATRQRIISRRGASTVSQSASENEEEAEVPGYPLAVSSDGSLLATAEDAGQVTLYNLNSFEKIEDLTFADQILTAQFSPDGKKLFVLTTILRPRIYSQSLRCPKRNARKSNCAPL